MISLFMFSVCNLPLLRIGNFIMLMYMLEYICIYYYSIILVFIGSVVMSPL